MAGTFEAGIPAGRRNSGIIGTGSAFPENVPYAHGVANFSSNQDRPNAFLSAIAAALRLIFPVIVLLTTFAAAYLYNDTKLSSLGIRGDDLTLGYLLLPTTFFAIQLTNRRYGPGHAFAQIVVTWIVVAAGLLLARNYIGEVALPNPFPTTRLLGAFAAALFLAQTVSVIVFDGARGPRWWSAPVFSSLWGAVVFCAIFYPAAFMGTASAWLNEMLLGFGLMAGMTIVLTLPYWLLRPLVRPMPGFGGY